MGGGGRGHLCAGWAVVTALWLHAALSRPPSALAAIAQRSQSHPCPRPHSATGRACVAASQKVLRKLFRKEAGGGRSMCVWTLANRRSYRVIAGSSRYDKARMVKQIGSQVDLRRCDGDERWRTVEARPHCSGGMTWNTHVDENFDVGDRLQARYPRALKSKKREFAATVAEVYEDRCVVIWADNDPNPKNRVIRAQSRQHPPAATFGGGGGAAEGNLRHSRRGR